MKRICCTSWRKFSTTSASLLQHSSEAPPLVSRRFSVQTSERQKKCLGKSNVVTLKQSGDFHSGDAGNTTGERLHLVREFVVHAAGRFVHRSADQILQHLLIF